MGRAHQLWIRILRPKDPRDEREIEGDIDQELAFHLEQRERDLVAAGLSPEEAHAEALRRFGNVNNIRAACRRVQLGGKVMLQRITLVLVIALLAIVAWLTQLSVASQRAARSEIGALHANVQRLMVELEKKSVAPTSGIGNTRWSDEAALRAFLAVQTEGLRGVLVQPSPQASNGQLTRPGLDPEAWLHMDTAQRRALGDELLLTRDEWVVRDVIHRFVTDPSEELALRGLDCLRQLTLVHFELSQRAEYVAWHEKNRGRELLVILVETAPALLQRLKLAPGFNEECARYSKLPSQQEFGLYFAPTDALSNYGGIDLAERWTRDPDPRARVAALNWLTALEVDEVTRRKLVVAMVAAGEPRDPEFLPTLCRSMGEVGGEWGVELLLKELDGAFKAAPRHLETLLGALSGADSEVTLPQVLAHLFAANSEEVTELCGRTLLREQAGIEPDPRHDAEWWRNWWMIHRDQYPAAPRDPVTGLPLVR